MARRTLPNWLAKRIPGISPLARLVARIAEVRMGRVPVGLLALVPVALALDFLDFVDELGGPLGMIASFFLETSFVLGLTGRGSYALGFAGIDLIPGVDILPVATLTLAKFIADAWNDRGRDDEGRVHVDGPVIDV